MSRRLYLGIDIGTSVTKGTIIDNDGNIVAQSYSPLKYESSIKDGYEHNPDDVWWNEFQEITGTLLEASSGNRAIHGIAVTGMIPNITPVDINGKPLSNGILFYDGRAYEIEKKLDRDLGTPKWQNEVLSKLLWLQENRKDVWNSIHKILTTHSYIVHRLTGQFSVDFVTAIESGNIYSSKNRTWNSEILGRYQIPINILPDLYAPQSIVGYLTDDAAERLGLISGIPVVAGTGDTISSLLGAGLRKKGEMLIYYGTYNCSALLNFDINDVISGSITSNPLEWTSTIPRSGQQLNSLAQQLFPSETRQASLSKLDDFASMSKPGANGVLFIQTLDLPISTVSTEPKGGIINITVENTLADMARAILEAFGYGMRYSFDVLGTDPNPVKCFAAGGGAKSSIWRQIVSDITGYEQMYYPAADRGVGSAILAGSAVEVDFLSQITERMMMDAILTKPDSSKKDIYDANYEQYCAFLQKLNS